MRIMIVVTHLLGTGHVARAGTLGQAFADAGHEVHMASGGRPAPHLDKPGVIRHQLPSLRSDKTDFARLLDENDQPAGSELRAKRIRMLLDLHQEVQPDVVITELFPFGRRNLRDEFVTLIKAVDRTRTIVCTSIRDILEPQAKVAKHIYADDTVQSLYDAVLVHGDPDFADLSLSWPVSDALRAKLQYTGFVAPPEMPSSARRDGIIVSTGGGAIGDKLFETVMKTAPLLPDQSWTLFMADAVRARLAAEGPPNVELRPLSADFRTHLAAARTSVSMVGYNTSLDVMQSGTPAVLVPFDEGGEVEQTLRARAMADLPGISVCPYADLSPERLRSAVQSVLDAPPRAPKRDRMDGAAETVAICERLWRARVA